MRNSNEISRGYTPSQHPDLLVSLPKILPGVEAILDHTIKGMPYNLDSIDPVYRDTVTTLLDPKPLEIDISRPFYEWITRLEPHKNIINGVFIGMAMDQYQIQRRGERRNLLIPVIPNFDYNYRQADEFIRTYRPNSAETIDSNYMNAVHHLIRDIFYSDFRQSLADVMSAVEQLPDKHPLGIFYQKLGQLTEFSNSLGLIDGSGVPTDYSVYDFIERGIDTQRLEADNLAELIPAMNRGIIKRLPGLLTRDRFTGIYDRSSIFVFGAFASGNVHVYTAILTEFKEQRGERKGRYKIKNFTFDHERVGINPKEWEKAERKVRTELYEWASELPASMQFQELTTTRCPAFSVRSEKKPSVIAESAHTISKDLHALNARHQ